VSLSTAKPDIIFEVDTFNHLNMTGQETNRGSLMS